MAVPKLRFKDENGADYPYYITAKIGKVVTLLNGRAYSQDELLSGGKYRVLRVGNFFTNDSWYYSNMELDENKYANKGDLLYAWAATFGPRIWQDEKVIYHYHIWKVLTSDKIDKKFLNQWFLQDVQKLKNKLNGGIMVHITKGEMEKRNIELPCLEEQKKIADFLTTFDKRITAQQNIIADMEEIKKGLLQKIFSQEIRFKDDNGEDYPAPKREILSKLLSEEISNGVFNDPKKQGYGKRLINVVNLYVDGYIDYEQLGLVDVDDKEFVNNKVKNGDLFFTRSSLKVEGIAHCNIFFGKQDDVTYDGHIMKATINPNIANPLYVMYFMRTHEARKQLMAFAKTTTMTTIGQSELKCIEVICPSLSEQNKIASFLSTYDKKLEAEKKILADLQEMKKGLLQQMFV